MSPAPAIAAIAATAAGWWYLTAPGRTVGTAVQDLGGLLSGNIRLSEAQKGMVGIITSEFGAAGLAWLQVAAVVNAYAESRLDPTAIGDNGHAVGLFQLNDANPKAAGYGMSVRDRQDPWVNTRRIIEVVHTDGRTVLAGRGRTNEELTSLFARWVERCAACGWSAGSGELAVRMNLCHQLYGASVALTVP